MSDSCMTYKVDGFIVQENGIVRNGETLELIGRLSDLQELTEENERYKKRLVISPQGDDKIDELEEAIEQLRFQLEEAQKKETE